MKTTKLTVLILILSTMFACTGEKQVEESKANENLFIGLLTGVVQSTNFLTEYNGNWNVGFTYDANGTMTGTPQGRMIVATNPDGSGSIISGNSPAAWGDTTYRIVAVNKSNRNIYYQNTPGTNNGAPSTYGRFDLTPVLTTGCELGASKCFYICERVTGKASLNEVYNDTSTSDSTKYASNGCNGFSFNRALFRSDNSTWTGI
ncbi:hypothetical protein P3G55_07460 [Leptospira sp. 96542]|nr:hypothetical protein [Leptospira sp. 96542]